jgi:hypothetical protein
MINHIMMRPRGQEASPVSSAPDPVLKALHRFKVQECIEEENEEKTIS